MKLHRYYLTPKYDMTKFEDIPNGEYFSIELQKMHSANALIKLLTIHRNRVSSVTSMEFNKQIELIGTL